MGSPAARIADLTAHGGTIVMGEPTVLIGYMMAARVTDNHVCPMWDGPKPHVGGPIIMGAWTVLVGFMPQSRISDMCLCAGPPDMIAKGEPTVLVGMSGGMGGMGAMMGAAMGALGKVMEGGFPKAVQMPDGSVVTQFNESITIEGTPEFQAKTVADLNKIAGTESGKKLLKSMNDSGKKLTIREAASTADEGAGNDPHPSEGGLVKADGTPGDKANAQVWHYPELDGLGDIPGDRYKDPDWAQPGEMTSDVALFHEMVHADDRMNGRMDRSSTPNAPPYDGEDTRKSEMRAVGIGDYEDEEYSENTYRKERGKKPRTFY